MSEPNPFDPPSFTLLSGDPPIQLKLYHYVTEHIDTSRGARKPVLLLHGASASHQTFLTPRGGLAKWLAREHFDTWLLDWRGSGRVVDDDENKPSLLKNGTVYNFNLAAKHDIPEAIAVMRDQGVEGKIAVLGFCMGGAILAESVALGHITENDVDRIVLMALGLFYEATIDGRVKCEDRILEHLEQGIRAGVGVKPWIDPRLETNALTLKAPWDSDLEDLYKEWPNALKSHAEDPQRTVVQPDDAVNRMCNRLSFMYGMPYHHHNLVNTIHDPSSEDRLPDLFGAIPLHMFIHGARNIRKGHATFYKADATVYDDDAENELIPSEEARENFRRLSKVTLITGALNRLWHRNSIDLMHEWLCRGTPDHLRKFKKHVFPDYAHQDLLWGTKSEKSIFPRIKEGLEP